MDNRHAHQKGLLPSKDEMLEIQRETMRKRCTNNLTFHPAQAGQEARYSALRAKALEFALLIIDTTPLSREQAIALTKLENAVMWANAAIARNE